MWTRSEWEKKSCVRWDWQRWWPSCAAQCRDASVSNIIWHYFVLFWSTISWPSHAITDSLTGVLNVSDLSYYSFFLWQDVFFHYVRSFQCRNWFVLLWENDKKWMSPFFRMLVRWLSEPCGNSLENRIENASRNDQNRRWKPLLFLCQQHELEDRMGRNYPYPWSFPRNWRNSIICQKMLCSGTPTLAFKADTIILKLTGWGEQPSIEEKSWQEPPVVGTTPRRKITTATIISTSWQKIVARAVCARKIDREMNK